MKLTASATLAVGGSSPITLHVSDENDRMAVVWAHQLANPRETCNVCGHIGLEEKKLDCYRTKDGFPYVKIICPCGAESSLGAHKTEGYFWPKYEDPPEGVGKNREGEPAAESCTREQAEAIAKAASAIGFSGSGELFRYVTEALGRTVERLGELSRAEAELILKGLREF